MSKHTLTQYSVGNVYVSCQLEKLANSAGTYPVRKGDLAVGQEVFISNSALTYHFSLKTLDNRPEQNAHYYELTRMHKHYGAMVGAKAVMQCNQYDMFKQGDIATISRNSGASGWWAIFENGQEWNIGFGHDFIVYEVPGKVSYSTEASEAIFSMSDNNKKVFDETVSKIEKKLNKAEILTVSQWLNNVLYFEVTSTNYLVYPSNIRLLISFNTDTGEFFKGRYKHYIVRKGWATFIKQLINFKPLVQPDYDLST